MRPAQRERAAQTARTEQGRVLILLYEGAIRFLGEAANAFENQRDAEALERLDRAERILRELARALDLAHGGPVARKLNHLYDYCSRRLVDAGAAHDPRPATEVAGLLDDLLGAWRLALRKLGPVTADAQTPAREEQLQ
jgi:flagellar protein FliS